MVSLFKIKKLKKDSGYFWFLLFFTGILPLMSQARDRIILDWPADPHPDNWTMHGYAFGTRSPHPDMRQQAAVPTDNQQQFQTGEMISPEFVLHTDYLQVTCSGVYHPTRCAVRLIVDEQCVRSCSPEPGSGFKKEGQKPATYWFDLRTLQGKTARISVKDDHTNGFLDSVRIVATDKAPPKDVKIVKSDVSWLPDSVQIPICGDFLLLPVGPLAGTPLQSVTLKIAGQQLLTTDLPLAFASIPVAGYLPVYDLTAYPDERLTLLFHSFTGHEPGESSAKVLIQNEIPGRMISDTEPALHIHPRLGKLNDPNGLVYMNGTYHLFHQYKYNITACSWAHYISTDLMHWRERPIALFHDDMGSMHSGSAALDVMNTSGRQRGEVPPLIAAYTASLGFGGKDKIQMQCIAYSTDSGRTFTKYKGNPVIGKDEIYAKGSCNNRDPKIFWYSPTRGMDPDAKDGHWVMVLYQRRQENGHTIFTSNNLRDWTEQSRVEDLRECPELFPLAIDGDPDRIRWILHGSKGDYHIGTFDGKEFTPQTETKLPMFYRQDMSVKPDLYAAQTFNNTPEGDGGQPRRIQVAWFRKGNQLSVATELKLRSTPFGLRVCRLPVREISNLYTNTHSLNGLSLYPESPNPLKGITGGLYDIDIQADLSHAEQLALNVRGAALVIDVTDDGLSLNEMRIPGTKQLELRMVVDHTLVEVFFGEHGLYSYPVGYQSLSEELAVKLRGKKAIFDRLQVHELKSIWESE